MISCEKLQVLNKKKNEFYDYIWYVLKGLGVVITNIYLFMRKAC